jgi:hypothetical protein
MSIRNCIFTNLPSKNRNFVVPKDSNDDISQNWANAVPCHQEYNEFKKDRLPTDDELEAMKIFFKLEVAKVELAFYSSKLEEVQNRIKPIFDEFIKEKQIKKSYIEAEIVEDAKIQIKDLLAERKKNLFE